MASADEMEKAIWKQQFGPKRYSRRLVWLGRGG